jgi:hypothetical protein
VTDDELAAIEARAKELFRSGLTHGGISGDVRDLVAEVRRLRTEEARLRQAMAVAIEEMHDGEGRSGVIATLSEALDPTEKNA